MRKKTFIGFLCLFLTASCMLSAISIAKRETTLPKPKTSVITETKQQTVPTVKVDSKDPVTLEKGNPKIVTLTKDEQSKLLKWTSSDSNIVTVDSGGRIDGLKTGTATISAHYNDNTKSECTVTVVNEKKQSVDRYSTAITANSDVLNKNIKSNSYKNVYMIRVNRQMNCVTVYTYDESGNYTVPVRAMICSCGKNDGTILGTYNLYFKSEWLGLFNNVYGHYVSGISGDYLFHSVPYYTENIDDLETEEYNKLGDFASLGCVRMAIADVKWIYQNCPQNTVIEIYDDDDAGPLGKPEAIKITDLSCGWDPTDDDKNNPYNKKNPVISGANDITAEAGSTIDLLGGVTAKDTCGNNITDKIEVFENVDTNRAGTYKLTYSVTDVLNRSDTVDVIVKIT